LEAYVKKYSLDAVRWYLLTQGPLGATDADFSHSKFIEVYNADLANGIGNCASRVGNMIEKYFGGAIPSPEPYSYEFVSRINGDSPLDTAMEARKRAGNPVPDGQRTKMFEFPMMTARYVKDGLQALDACDWMRAATAASQLVRFVDDFISHTAPF